MQEFLEGTVLLTWNSDVKVKLRHYMYCIHVFEATIYLIWVMSNVKHMHVSQCKFSTLKACSQYKCCCQVVVHSEGWGENGRKQTGGEASSGGHSWEAELSDQEWVSMNKIETKILDLWHDPFWTHFVRSWLYCMKLWYLQKPWTISVWHSEYAVDHRYPNIQCSSCIHPSCLSSIWVLHITSHR